MNAYEAKTGRSRDELAKLMQDDGTWMNAKKAVELGFADGVLYADSTEDGLVAAAYNPHRVIDSLSEQIKAKMPVSPEPEMPEPESEDIKEPKDRTELQIRMRMLGIRV